MDFDAILFFDSKAAFPSISHEFMVETLLRLGLPKESVFLIQSLYHNNKCKLSFKGGEYDGFDIQAGIRQGCPLSPILFACVIDGLLRKIKQASPTSTVRAFADDIGMVVDDFGADAEKIMSIFDRFYLASGLQLNLPKTVAIPLWEDEELESIQKAIGEKHDAWNKVAFQRYGTYLEFAEGPGKGDRSWDKAVAKLKTRTDMWRNAGAGLQYAIMAHNTFCISTLGFLGQLETPPKKCLGSGPYFARKSCTRTIWVDCNQGPVEAERSIWFCQGGDFDKPLSPSIADETRLLRDVGRQGQRDTSKSRGAQASSQHDRFLPKMQAVEGLVR